MIALISFVTSVVTNLLSDKIYEGNTKLCERISLWRFRTNLANWMHQYINAHDGSVLTTGSFERYLKRYKPVERMVESVSGVVSDITKEELLTDIINQFFVSDPNSRARHVKIRADLQDFFNGLYNWIESYYESKLSQNQRYSTGKTNQVKAELEKKMDSQHSENIEGMNRIRDLLESKGKLQDQSVIKGIYDSICELLQEGKADDVFAILPLLSGKNDDLEQCVKYLINLMSDYICCDISFETIQASIQDDYMYADITRKTVYYAMLENNLGVLDRISDRDAELFQIARWILENNDANFFSTSVHKEDGISCYEIKTYNPYPKEAWLVNRICMVRAFSLPVINMTLIMNQLLGDSRGLVDRILYFEKKTVELFMYDIQTTEEASLLTEMKPDIPKVCHVPLFLQVKFYTAILKLAISQSLEEATCLEKGLPSNVAKDADICMLSMSISMMKGEATLSDIVNLCVKCKSYWLFSNYLVTLQRDDHAIQGVIEKHKFILDEDIRVFLIYVQVISRLEGMENAYKLLKEYEDKYDNYFDYWLLRVEIVHNVEDIETILSRINSEEMCSLSFRTQTELSKLLIYQKKYKEALTIISRIEKGSRIQPEMLFLKGVALCCLKQELEALAVFNSVFGKTDNVERTLDYILTLSINNNRKVSDEVIAIAEKSTNSRILMLASIYNRKICRFNNALELIVRSMLRNQGENNAVFSNYIAFHLGDEATATPEICTTNANTMVSMHSKSTCGSRVYCIYDTGSNVLPRDSYLWEGAYHIYYDTAIQLGLFRRKTGDCVVVDDDEYQIDEIMPLDCYYFRLCMSKMVECGSAKAITVPMDADDKIRTEKFLDCLKEHMQDEQNAYQWLSDYNDCAKFPAPFYMLWALTSLSYSQFVCFMIESPSILQRESLGTRTKSDKGYVLTFSAFISLFELGLQIDMGLHKTIIPSVLKKELEDEARQIIEENKKEHVLKMGLYNGQVRINESTEEEKKEAAAKAVQLKEYCAQFSVLNNEHDLCTEDDDRLDIKELIGICDYDALSIAKTEGLVLVTAETSLVSLSSVAGIEVPTICIADYLVEMCSNVDEVLRCIQKMMHFRFIVPITCKVVRYVIDSFENASVAEKHTICDEWKKTLTIPTENKPYVKQIALLTWNVVNELHGDVNENSPIWRMLTLFLVEYMGYKIEIALAEDGEILTRLVKDDGSIIQNKSAAPIV